jgi:hypothetical protein
VLLLRCGEPRVEVIWNAKSFVHGWMQSRYGTSWPGVHLPSDHHRVFLPMPDRVPLSLA